MGKKKRTMRETKVIYRLEGSICSHSHSIDAKKRGVSFRVCVYSA